VENLLGSEAVKEFPVDAEKLSIVEQNIAQFGEWQIGN